MQTLSVSFPSSQYSIRRSILVPGGSVVSDEQMISGLDSALNEWLAAVPDNCE